MNEARQLVESEKYLSCLASHESGIAQGKVRQVVGLVVEVSGINSFIGEVCLIDTLPEKVVAEVVGFRDKLSLLMPLGDLKGIAPGCAVIPTGRAFTVRVGDKLKGRVLDGLGRLLDGGGLPLLPGEGAEYPVENSPPNPLERKAIREVLPTGIRAVDSLLTCGEGQRIGIFSGSGVGKTTMLAMIARYSESDINVIAMIGERGREVGDFLKNDLGPEGLKRSVVVVSTSDRPALERVRGALVAATIAEYFRDQGKKVVFMMDSVTRFCMAQREIGLAIGEPPSSKGYTPSVFALLARYLERSGTSARGSITGFYSVLVDGDDFTEPITDAARGILDGHIILSRKLASQNHFPSIDILNSISRLMPVLITREHYDLAAGIKKLLADYDSAEDLIKIGAYVSGSNEDIDRAIAKRKAIMNFLSQDVEEESKWEEVLPQLEELLH
ncbi:MAG: FliI/YscN family ATPase [Firmicutes bacterium]|nr:FliI/YscN family ATPase [Bacillota bacterium]